MSLQQDDYGNLIHGVSQQPDERKAKGQFREQINCRSHLTKGLSSRAGFRYIAELIPDKDNNGLLTDAKWLSQQRGDGVDFIMAFDVTRPCIFDTGGIRQVFKFDSQPVYDYYHNNISDIRNDLSISAVLDTTFVTNKKVRPKGDYDNDEVIAPLRVTWIEFKTFQAGTEIEITFATIASGSYITTVFDGYVTVDPSTGIPDPADSAKTKEFEGSYHAEAFAVQAADINVTQYNNWVRIQAPDINEVKIVKGGENIILHENKSIDAVEKIPAFAVQGDMVAVEASREEDKSLGYFIAKNKKGRLNVFEEASWSETVANGSTGVLFAETMPHALKRSSANSFVLEVIEWKDRQVGDKATNPYPSFIEVGTPITNVGVFQNRLYLSSNEIIFLSATDNYFDLWRESAFYNTDADPFEAFADTNELNVIEYAEDLDGDLVFFSENGQFLLSGDLSHTYKTAFIQNASQYKSNLTAKPVLSGDNIFFATDYGNFAGVRELFTDSASSTKRALPITAHVDEYITGSIRHMASSTNLDALLCLNAERDTVYVYEWNRNINGELKQQAWHKWMLASGIDIEWVGFLGKDLYTVVKMTTDSSEIHQLWKMAWDDLDDSDSINYAVSLDAKFFVNAIFYDAATDLSTFSVPFDRNDLVFIDGLGSVDEGFIVPATKIGQSQWQVKGDYSFIQLIAGIGFASKVDVPTPQMKDRNNASKGIDRLQLSSLHFRFSDVGKMKIKISDTHGRERTVKYVNRKINSPASRVGQVNTGEDIWNVSVRKKTRGLSLELSTDGVVPFALSAIEWRGDFKQKGKRT